MGKLRMAPVAYNYSSLGASGPKSRGRHARHGGGDRLARVALKLFMIHGSSRTVGELETLGILGGFDSAANITFPTVPPSSGINYHEQRIRGKRCKSRRFPS